MKISTNISTIFLLISLFKILIRKIASPFKSKTLCQYLFGKSDPGPNKIPPNYFFLKFFHKMF